ncbi:MAG: PAS domain S-box protein [Mariprofundaceae bacterium]
MTKPPANIESGINTSLLKNSIEKNVQLSGEIKQREMVLLLDDKGTHLQAGAAPGLPDAWNQVVDGGKSGLPSAPAARLHFAMSASLSRISPPTRCGKTTAIPHWHSGEDIQLIEQLASLTGIAIDNCRNRQQLEIARQQQEELIDTVNQSSDMIYVYGMDGLITTANEAANATFGGQVVGKDIAEIVAPDQLQLAQEMMQKKLTTGKSTVYELDVIDLHGQRHNLEINSSLIIRDGKPVAINGIARDITQRKNVRPVLHHQIYRSGAGHERHAGYRAWAPWRYSCKKPAWQRYDIQSFIARQRFQPRQTKH